MKSGVENMLEVYLKDKKRTKDLEAQLEAYNSAIEEIVQRIDAIKTNAGISKRGRAEHCVIPHSSRLTTLWFRRRAHGASDTEAERAQLHRQYGLCTWTVKE